MRRFLIRVSDIFRYNHSSWILAGVLVCTQVAYAEGGVSFSRNRVIFSEGEKAVTLTANNHGDALWLVQAGVSGSATTTTSSPFMVTPPLFRLEPRSQNVMRILRVGGQLPTDRESVFWFYANAIPSQPAPVGGAAKGAGVGASLSISMKTVLKLFWRPSGLKVRPQDAPGKMQFSWRNGEVVVNNPTPYYQTFATLKYDGVPQDTDSVPSMVAPFGELHFRAKQRVNKVSWTVMNDYGGATTEVTSPIK